MDCEDASLECARGGQKAGDARSGDHTYNLMWETALYKVVLRGKRGFC